MDGWDSGTVGLVSAGGETTVAAAAAAGAEVVSLLMIG